MEVRSNTGSGPKCYAGCGGAGVQVEGSGATRRRLEVTLVRCGIEDFAGVKRRVRGECNRTVVTWDSASLHWTHEEVGALVRSRCFGEVPVLQCLGCGFTAGDCRLAETSLHFIISMSSSLRRTRTCTLYFSRSPKRIQNCSRSDSPYCRCADKMTKRGLRSTSSACVLLFDNLSGPGASVSICTQNPRYVDDDEDFALG